VNVVYSAKCPLPNCKKHLGQWTSIEAAMSRVLEHLDVQHGARPVAVTGFERS
jgi:hypothetical protein